jgi:hypothetical protein
MEIRRCYKGYTDTSPGSEGYHAINTFNNIEAVAIRRAQATLIGTVITKRCVILLVHGAMSLCVFACVIGTVTHTMGVVMSLSTCHGPSCD